MRKHPFKQDLQDLLQKYNMETFTGLHNYMMAEHIVAWIEEYIREQNVAKTWGTK
jgi:predicted membrane chloride channel (bestrophin family)